MIKGNRKLELLRAAGIGLALAMTLVAAPLAAQDQGVEEVTAYQAWHAASTGGDTAKAAELARAYLEKFPKGQYAEYLTKWLAGAELTRFNDAIKKKDMATMVAVGQERLKQDPNDLTILYWMALNLRQNQLLASGEAGQLKEAGEFSRRAIELIEKGGQPTGIEAAKWNKDANLAWLHQSLALVAAKEGRSDEALKEYAASSGLAPTDAAILARNSLGCGSLNKSLYDKAVAKYQALPEAERNPESPSAGAKAAIDEANANADAAIECWARFLGVTAKGGAQDVRARIEPALAALYQYRHPEAPEGYKALVEKYSSGS